MKNYFIMLLVSVAFVLRPIPSFAENNCNKIYEEAAKSRNTQKNIYTYTTSALGFVGLCLAVIAAQSASESTPEVIETTKCGAQYSEKQELESDVKDDFMTMEMIATGLLIADGISSVFLANNNFLKTWRALKYVTNYDKDYYSQFKRFSNKVTRKLKDCPKFNAEKIRPSDNEKNVAAALNELNTPQRLCSKDTKDKDILYTYDAVSIMTAALLATNAGDDISCVKN